MKKYYWNEINEEDIKRLCNRTSIDFTKVFPIVKSVLKSVKDKGDKAVSLYTEKFDGIKLNSFKVTEQEIAEAESRISDDLKKAFKSAAINIEKFHKEQLIEGETIETSKGVFCFRQNRSIEKVGLYVPGGTAPLPSTVLMLGIPARIAGCSEIIMCTPPGKDGKVPDIILFAAKIAGINKIFKVGGAQAIAAMGYGTETIPKVYKIFGPGNQYVTAAKMLLSIEAEGASMDMPAGPSEVLVIADEYARADFVAADLLSQAEHGKDSQTVLVCTDEKKVDEILKQLNLQLDKLPRKEIALQSINNSFVLITNDISESLEFSNLYAPEHLILNIENAEKYLDKIENAGSVFIGKYSCESAGDYASGTNHTLPTYGYATSYSGVSVDSFLKKITFQKLTEEGVKNIGRVVEEMADVEKLQAHKNAMTLRLNFIKKRK